MDDDHVQHMEQVDQLFTAACCQQPKRRQTSRQTQQPYRQASQRSSSSSSSSRPRAAGQQGQQHQGRAAAAQTFQPHQNAGQPGVQPMDADSEYAQAAEGQQHNHHQQQQQQQFDMHEQAALLEECIQQSAPASEQLAAAAATRKREERAKRQQASHARWRQESPCIAQTALRLLASPAQQTCSSCQGSCAEIRCVCVALSASWSQQQYTCSHSCTAAIWGTDAVPPVAALAPFMCDGWLCRCWSCNPGGGTTAFCEACDADQHRGVHMHKREKHTGGCWQQLPHTAASGTGLRG
jgi:hypothetical protein